MVSKADSRSLAPCDSSTARQRRHGRSHTGRAYYGPQNSFPVFTYTGDMEILVRAGGKENRYLLHRLILAQCSGFFEASTSQEWSRATEERTTTGPVGMGELSRIGENSTSTSSLGGGSALGAAALTTTKKRWRYELDPGNGPDDVPMLVQKDTSARSLFNSDLTRSPPPPSVVRNKPASNSGFFRSMANLSLTSNSVAAAAPNTLSPEDEDLLRDYDNLFRIFYNYAPSLDAIDIAAAYTQCKTLLSLADIYDALPVIGPRVDHHLLQFQSRLFKQIAKYPPSYLKLAYLARSKTIFKEALIHVVSQWPASERHLRNNLPDNVLDVVDDKVEDLTELLKRIECKLLRLSLETSKGERVTPGNSWTDWLVVAAWRQWFVEATDPPPAIKSSSRHNHRNHRRHNDNRINPQTTTTTTTAPPISTQLIPSSTNPLPSTPYHRISLLSPTLRTVALNNHNQSSYLNHDECKKFLKEASSSGGEHYSRDALKRFERKMEEMKALAAEVVKAECALDCGLVGVEAGVVAVGRLYCVRVGEGDFPWGEWVCE